MNLSKTSFLAVAVLATVTSFANAETNGASTDGAQAQDYAPQRTAGGSLQGSGGPQDDSGGFDVDQLLDVILNWGTNDANADLNKDGTVNIDDLVSLFVRIF